MKVMISACLAGQPVRFNGRTKSIDHPAIRYWTEHDYLVPVCPEVLGGLPVPRKPAEMLSGDLVVTSEGQDVTSEFKTGARQTLIQCKLAGASMAVLTANSPSCGSNQVYDGSFTGQLTDGDGLTAKLLKQSQIKVFSTDQLDQAWRYWQQRMKYPA